MNCMRDQSLLGAKDKWKMSWEVVPVLHSPISYIVLPLQNNCSIVNKMFPVTSKGRSAFFFATHEGMESVRMET